MLVIAVLVTAAVKLARIETAAPAATLAGETTAVCTKVGLTAGGVGVGASVGPGVVAPLGVGVGTDGDADGDADPTVNVAVPEPPYSVAQAGAYTSTLTTYAPVGAPAGTSQVAVYERCCAAANACPSYQT